MITNGKHQFIVSKSLFIYIFILYITLGLSLRILGIESGDSIQKLIFLIFVTCLLIINNIDRTSLTPLILFIFASSIVLIPGIPMNVDTKVLIFAFLGMLPAFLFYSIKFRIDQINKIAMSAAYIPIISIAIFILLLPVYSYQFITFDYLGSFRLRPFHHPTHFAMLCFISLAFFTYLSILNKKIYLIPIFFCLILILATASRGAIFASFLILLPLLQFWRTKILWYIFFITSPVLSVLFYYIINNILNRNVSSIDGNINLSGRDLAWDFFLLFTKGNEFFGNGLGFVTTLTKNIEIDNLSAFVTPHNEFIRFYVDLGISGSIIYWLSILSIVYTNFKISNYQIKIFIIFLTLSTIFFSYIDNFFSTPQSLFGFFIIMKYIQVSQMDKSSV